jgi:hypothetical protein
MSGEQKHTHIATSIPHEEPSGRIVPTGCAVAGNHIVEISPTVEARAVERAQVRLFDDID